MGGGFAEGENQCEDDKCEEDGSVDAKDNACDTVDGTDKTVADGDNVRDGVIDIAVKDRASDKGINVNDVDDPFAESDDVEGDKNVEVDGKREHEDGVAELKDGGVGDVGDVDDADDKEE